MSTIYSATAIGLRNSCPDSWEKEQESVVPPDRIDYVCFVIAGLIGIKLENSRSTTDYKELADKAEEFLRSKEVASVVSSK